MPTPEPPNPLSPPHRTTAVGRLGSCHPEREEEKLGLRRVPEREWQAQHLRHFPECSDGEAQRQRVRRIHPNLEGRGARHALHRAGRGCDVRAGERGQGRRPGLAEEEQDLGQDRGLRT